MQQQMTPEQQKALEEKIKNMSPEELKEFQKQQCIFCQIVSGKIPSKKVYEDDKCLAVMDINPAAIGHILLLPKEHYAIMPQVPEEVIGHMFTVAKHLSQAMLRKLKVEGTTIFVANGPVAGQRAQHFMIHIIPRKEGDGVLEVPEHLIDEKAREKLGEIIGNKVNELLGIKKKRKSPIALPRLTAEEGEVVEADFEDVAEEKKEESEGEKESEETEEKEESDEEVKETEEADEESEESEEKEEADEESEESEEKEEADEESKESEEKEEAEGEESEESDEEANLDDIAGLFK